MRIRGRRVALLVASALPLLADESIQYAITTDTSSTNDGKETISAEHEDSSPPSNNNQALVIDEEEDENDFVPLTATEAIHSDGFKLPSLSSSTTATGEKNEPEGKTSATTQRAASSNSATPSDTTNDAIQETTIESSESTKPQQVDTTTNGEKSNGAETDNTDTQASDGEGESTETSGMKPGDTSPPPHADVEGTEGNSSPGTTQNVADNNIQTNEDSLTDEAASDENSGASTNANVSSNITNDDKTNAEESIELVDGQIDESPPETNLTDVDVGADETEANKSTTASPGVDEDDDMTNRVSVDYASKSAGALIIEKSKTFKGTSSLLNGDKDKYAIAPCEDKKFVVVSLSEDILVKEIKIANYERFSSSVKDFQVLGSQTLGKWFDLGTYTAKSGNGEQVFELLETAWARYLKFKFLSHHGLEYYCTYSQIKVHGSTMVQGFHEQWNENEDNEDILVEEDDLESTQIINDRNGTAEEGSEPTEPVVSGGGTTGGGANDKTLEETRSGTNGDDDPQKNNPSCDDDSSPASCPPPLVAAGHEQLSQTYHSSLDAMLHGAVDDEKLFSELYHLIPSTLGRVPTESWGHQEHEDGDLRTLHQIGTQAIRTLFSSSQMAADVAKALIPENSGMIVSPRMSDAVGGIISEYFGSELQAMTPSARSGGDRTPTPDTSTRSEKPSELSVHEASAVGEKDNQKETDEINHAQATSDGRSRNASKQNTTAENGTSTDHDTSSITEKGPPREYQAESEGTLEESQMDITLAKLLENLPSAECLAKLNYTEFKSRMMSARKATGGGGPAHSIGSMEPIFKRLTDEIKALQTNLSIQDQFTKSSVACYQRILVDLILEIEKMRDDQGQRLRRLEFEFKRSRESFFLKLSRPFVNVAAAVVRVLVSAFLCFYSWAQLATSGLRYILIRINAMIFHRIMQAWPEAKRVLLSTESGVNIAETMTPLIDHMDQLVAEFPSRDGETPVQLTDAEELWRFPIVPTIIALLVCRLIMCCTGSSTRPIEMLSRQAASSLSPRMKKTRTRGRKKKSKTRTRKEHVSESVEPTIESNQKEDRKEDGGIGMPRQENEEELPGLASEPDLESNETNRIHDLARGRSVTP